MSNSLFTPPVVETLDDLLYKTYCYIINDGRYINGKRGDIKEALNFSITLSNPKSRVSKSLDRRFVKSKFAELAWYLSKDSSKKFIEPYIPLYSNEESEQNKILGAYGSKIFGSSNDITSQFERVCEQIIARKDTKQAFLVLSNEQDYKVNYDKFSSPPCTIGLHFYVRNDKLNLTVYMRSNDAYYGLPHDLFCFTLLQEMVSFKVNIPIGNYTHTCTSLHIYSQHIKRVRSYLEEGLHESIVMPSLDNCSDVTLDTVVRAYNDEVPNVDIKKLSPFWHDYALFSNRFEKKGQIDEWLKMFKLQQFKEIAKSSKSK